jgi:starch phosphorylase
MTDPTTTRDALDRLALDLRHTFDHSPQEIWGRLDPQMWLDTHSRWAVLNAASDATITELLESSEGAQLIERLMREDELYQSAEKWFDRLDAPEGFNVAYFSMEFMLSEGLPVYSGGLGNVAGDQLKAASDLGVPVTGVGLLYQQGYFRQEIDLDGSQVALRPFNDPGHLPLRPLRGADGSIVRVKVLMANDEVVIRAWEAQVGACRLLLLDSNDPSNSPARRTITSELYGGGDRLRLVQEIVLGIGGWKVLRAIGIAPTVCHLNEGHAAFVVLERAREHCETNGGDFLAALERIRAGTLFTTHTPVSAGFDNFDPQLVHHYLHRYIEEEIGRPAREVLSLGQIDQGPFMPSTLAVRTAGAINGVSRLHGEVSRMIFAPLFHRVPIPEVPVGSITNGIHMATWDNQHSDALWNAVLPKRFDGHTSAAALAEAVDKMTDEALWSMRNASRAELCGFVSQRARRGLIEPDRQWTSAAPVLHPEVLTLGFARRFATYKRAHLLLSDPDRLVRLLTDRSRPVQLLVAGKAHPSDHEGQAILRRWIEFVRRPELEGRIVFVTDYDMLVTRHLVSGVDVWMNTPLKPYEASGTSGMKVLPNGGLNVAVADGWWAEVDDPLAGWSVGTGYDDRGDAKDLFRILEDEVIPLFYERDDRDIPTGWLDKVRASMKLCAQYSADRTVREYTERCYLPLAQRLNEALSADEDHDHIHRQLIAAWPHVKVSAPTVDRADDQDVVRVLVDPGALSHEHLIVELVADPWQLIPMRPVGRNDLHDGQRPVGRNNLGQLYEAVLEPGWTKQSLTPRVRANVDRSVLSRAAMLITWPD